MAAEEPRVFFAREMGHGQDSVDHPDYPIEKWKAAVARDDTRLSYEDWCQDAWAEEGDSA